MTNTYSYCKELDPFSKDFDPERALKEFDIPGPSSSSIDQFEQELMEADETKELVDKLKRIENTKTDGNTSKHPKLMVGDRTRRLMVKNKVLQGRYDEAFRRTGIEYFDGVGFALAHGGTYDCLRKWVKNQTRVTIKLKANSPKLQPNRCLQAIITAFDKHRNLLVRDCDEVYMPAKRPTHENAMPSGQQYTQLGDSNILSRYSKCSIIAGRTIACIYEEQESAVE